MSPRWESLSSVRSTVSVALLFNGYYESLTFRIVPSVIIVSQSVVVSNNVSRRSSLSQGQTVDVVEVRLQ